MTIAMIIAIAETTMYVIRSDVVARFEAVVTVGTGVGVAAAAVTTKVLPAAELP